LSEEKKYIKLEDLEVYKLSRELSEMAWRVYGELEWNDKKIMGDQFVRATDSIGANIAEGYGRFHYLEKLKFYYYARGSYYEANNHWLSLLKERNLINEEYYQSYKNISNSFSLKLNNYIATIQKKNKEHKNTSNN
jgi:four helix bundle protein